MFLPFVKHHRKGGNDSMNQTIFENLPRKMNLISDLFSRVVFRDKDMPRLSEDYSGRGV